MKDFIYYAPTQVVFGALSEDKTGKLVKQYGGAKRVTVFSKLADNEETGACAALSVIGVLLVAISFVMVVVIDSIASNIINAIFNPEFWALDYLLENFI